MNSARLDEQNLLVGILTESDFLRLALRILEARTERLRAVPDPEELAPRHQAVDDREQPEHGPSAPPASVPRHTDSETRPIRVGSQARVDHHPRLGAEEPLPDAEELGG